MISRSFLKNFFPVKSFFEIYPYYFYYQALRRFVITDEVVVDELSVNMEKMNIEKRKTVNVEKSSVTSKHGSSVTETATEKVYFSSFSLSRP